jgi:3-isopropylmalate dehydratase small subunit
VCSSDLCLLGGLDEIGLTLDEADVIDAFEAKDAALRPWLVPAVA